MKNFIKENKTAILFILFMLIVFAINLVNSKKASKEKGIAFKQYVSSEIKDTVWRGASEEQIPYYTDRGKLIWYGHELIVNTSFNLGLKGITQESRMDFNRIVS